jgi:hypothetical protein
MVTISRGTDPGDLAKSPFVELEGVASLKLQLADEAPRNHVLIQDGAELSWIASPAEWREMTYFLDPFLAGKMGHQYLTTEGVDDVLIEVSFGEAT